MSDHLNIVRIKAVYAALEELGDQVVFVGGATVSLYADRETEEARPTDDVDILVELTSYHEYASIEEKLRQKGFVNDIESKIVCRYKVQGIVVDVMPTDEKILGFSNRWYSKGVQHVTVVDLNGGTSVKIFTSPYFLASKLEAFKNRGNNDGRWSTDFEDIVYLLNNRSSIWHEIEISETAVKTFLLDEFRTLLKNAYLDEWVGCHLEYNQQDRIGYIRKSMTDLVNIV